MSPLQQYSDELESAIRKLISLIVTPRMDQFEDVWQIANKVCDRYNVGGHGSEEHASAA